MCDGFFIFSLSSEQYECSGREQLCVLLVETRNILTAVNNDYLIVMSTFRRIEGDYASSWLIGGTSGWELEDIEVFYRYDNERARCVNVVSANNDLIKLNYILI